MSSPIAEPIQRKTAAEREYERAVAAVLRNAEDRPLYLEKLYAGRSAFLVCSGPSAAGLVNLIPPYALTMAVNNAPVLKPTLWTCMDPPKHFPFRHWMNPTTLKFVPYCYTTYGVREDAARPQVPDCPGVVYYWRTFDRQPEAILKPRSIWCGQEPEETKPSVRSVMLPALRILYELGVRRVFIIGADMTGRPAHDPEYFQKLKALLRTVEPILAAAGMNIMQVPSGPSHLTDFQRIEMQDAVFRARREQEEWP